MKDITLTKNLPQISNNRCQQRNEYGHLCNRWLMVVGGKETCIVCDSSIGKETKDIELEMGKKFLLAKNRKNLDVFKNESLVNERLKNATFENYEPTNEILNKSKDTMKRYVDKFSKDNPVPLILMGSYGLGKSHLAYATAKELAEKGLSTLFISVPKLLTKIKATYNDNSNLTEENILNALENLDCLILDDIGAEQTKVSSNGEVSWSTQKLFEIIDSRIGKHTIFTTNLDYAELQKHLGPRNFSRLMENVHVIKMTGNDYRLRRFKHDMS